MNNENIMIVDITENLVSAAIQEVAKLKPVGKKQKLAKSQTYEDLDYIQKFTLFKLRQNFEGD